MPKPPPREETRGAKPRAGVASRPIAIRLTDDEIEKYEAAAEASKPSMSLSQWIRAACEAFLKRRSK